MSKVEVNEIDKQSGSTLTIGGSGTTVQLGTGASQTGFGASGAVNWETTKKTGTFTATSGEGYFCDTSSTAFTVNLPAGSAGAIVAVADYTRTFATNNLTIEADGTEKIGGTDGPVVLAVNGQAATFVYVDATEGWINVQNVEDSEKGKTQFIEATGGTITNTPTCRIHTFTGPGTFEVTCSATCAANNVLSYVVVAGGGSGGTGTRAGGGGAGGYREAKSPVTPYTASPLDGYPSAPNRITLPIGTADSFPITVGAGGATAAYPGAGNQGNDSIFSTITAAGGGKGGSNATPFQPAILNGSPGGSGGGGASNSSVPTAPGGTGNTPPTSPAQGTNGGEGNYPRSGGGGGGATAAGTNGGTPDNGGPGGAGATTEISASPVARAGGGGGGADAPAGAGGTGGAGGGGKGGCGPVAGPSLGVAGTANTGGGGGASGGGDNSGSAGGSGVVIIRYKIA